MIDACPVVYEECLDRATLAEMEVSDVVLHALPQVASHGPTVQGLERVSGNPGRAVCRMPLPECLPRDLVSDLRSAGANDWEIATALAFGRGPISIAADGDCGWPSLDPCPWDDPELVLYSDQGPAEVLRVWRRRIHPAVRAAEAHGWEPHIAAGIANNWGQGRFRREAEACAWELACVALAFGDTPHRRRRLAALGVL